MTESTSILLDTSFIINWAGITGYSNQEKCEQELTNSFLIAPILLKYEIGNVLLKYKNIINITPFLKQLEQLNIKYINIDNLSPIYEYAKKYKLSFYDASYIHILLTNNSIQKFLTFDNDFSQIEDQRIKIFKHPK